jgi:PAS domain S-box-containing protein
VHWLDRLQVNDWRVRAIPLLVAVVAIVWLPYMVVRKATSSSAEASQALNHSAEVKAAEYQLLHALRDMETSVLSVYATLPDAGAPERYEDDHAQVMQLLERLRDLTRDNPAQQVRIGNLEAIAEGRMERFDHALADLRAGDRTAALMAISDAQRLFTFRDTADTIADAEAVLYRERGAVAAVRQRNAEWIMLAAVVVQFLLLGMVVLLAERQVRNRLAAESEAKRATERSQRIVQSVREPIALVDEALRLLLANTAFAELYGHHGVIRVGDELEQAGDGAWADAALLQRLSDVARRGRELWDYELTQPLPDQSERIVLVNARRIALPESNDPVILLTASDITARKRSEEQILELNIQLEDKVEQISDVNRELEAFSYSVSHDLRAPLRHIAGFAAKLDQQLDTTDDKIRHYIEVIESSARRMSDLIESLLVYSRLGRHALRLQTVDMQSLVEDVRAMLESDVGERRIEWRVAPLPGIVADENMMRQVWQNLLGNAVKYTAGQPVARIEVASRRSPRGEYVFSVKDNGVGFDMQYAGKLFGVFQRLHKASEFAGTGIGLANVRRILVRHGGRIWADAAAGQGATFEFLLPANGGGAATRETTA